MAVQLLRGPFTVADYYRMAECGVLRPDERVELLDGQVVPMTPIGSRHQGCVDCLNRLMQQRAGGAVIVRVQGPVHLEDRSEPEPDLALLAPRADTYRTAHPRPEDTLLVIEVADTSLEFDRDVKVPLYAGAGIPEAWLVDLNAGRIEVYLDPASGAYATTRLAVRGDTLSPLLLKHVSLTVDEILG
jgi:Uma2 family endonuclease